jgi:sec-independent protein translocase protein TatA
MGLGTGEIILIIFLVVIVFGASRLPQLGDGLGRAIGSFKRALGGSHEVEAAPKKDERETAAPPAGQESAKPTDKTP